VSQNIISLKLFLHKYYNNPLSAEDCHKCENLHTSDLAICITMNWKQKLLGKWSWKRPFISLLWIYIMLVVFAYFFGSKLLFRPPHSGYAHDGLRYRSMENGVTPKIGYTWLAPHDDKSPVLFFSHGNAEDIADYEWLFDEWNQAGCGVFAYDYPGYGISEGSPTESSVNDATSKA
jgi:hypothetical protein